ncbi:hypothetical protein MKJ04_16590 [Pontibacter sp. E15-1]|uniref:hypothetical protein n=1 Tax=Pontibacter sp. E15-1 TaxID=2919918 RepID=UPI001F50386A|nr:hypothetical protein [Pontibacter sp. E15-1]MCJ8166465.1 hypothetical protein [Pontibacter sp. E15-1]
MNLLKPPYLLSLLVFALLGTSGCSDRFEHSVQQIPFPADTTSLAPVSYKDSTVTVAAGTHYKRSKLHTFFYGKHYRDVWTTPVTVPVLDLGTAHGGLTPVRLGGSRQSISLHLQDTAGTEYVLRSVDKEPASSLPEKWQRSYLANIARDATSATHPYAALVLPAMADALGMYYVVPELVYVPHDARLGKFKKTMGGTLALLERRPSGDQSDYAPMGRASHVKSSRSAITERLSDNDSYFDARFYLKARLFDMLIGDWSRHEDNWRWAEEAHAPKAYTYKAIPRDRDNVFYRLNDAPIPWLFMQLNLKPHFQTFRSKIENVEKLNRSGRNLDELILAELDWKDWEEMVDSVQHALTDEVIEQGFRAMPEPVAAVSAPAIKKMLRSRRDGLLDAAYSYYSTLASTVQVVGTDKHERFEVAVLSPEQVRVRMYKTNKKGDERELRYERTFEADDTEEIRLYGLNGDDHFSISGNVRPNLKISVWGGAGEDSYQVEGQGSKLGKQVLLIDTKYRNTYEVDKHTTVEIDDDLKAKDFDAEGWLLHYYLN